VLERQIRDRLARRHHDSREAFSKDRHHGGVISAPWTRWSFRCSWLAGHPTGAGCRAALAARDRPAHEPWRFTVGRPESLLLRLVVLLPRCPGCPTCPRRRGPPNTLASIGERPPASHERGCQVASSCLGKLNPAAGARSGLFVVSSLSQMRGICKKTSSCLIPFGTGRLH
jgi:hypothetical protein